jgi:hypothetical protein
MDNATRPEYYRSVRGLPGHAARWHEQGGRDRCVIFSLNGEERAMYIDPAAGSLILQVLVAGILAVTTTVRSARESVKKFFRGMFGRRHD